MLRTARTDSAQAESIMASDWYFTSPDLNRFEGVLTEAMAELERSVVFANDELRQMARLRLAAAIMRRASFGERDPNVLRRVALKTFSYRNAMTGRTRGPRALSGQV